MQPRIEYAEVAPAGMAAMLGLENYVRQSGFDPALLELVKLRASQINGCAYCLDMHTKDARARGESEGRGATRGCCGASFAHASPRTVQRLRQTWVIPSGRIAKAWLRRWRECSGVPRYLMDTCLANIEGFAQQPINFRARTT